jgi:hypothetical protein
MRCSATKSPRGSTRLKLGCARFILTVKSQTNMRHGFAGKAIRGTTYVAGQSDEGRYCRTSANRPISTPALTTTDGRFTSTPDGHGRRVYAKSGGSPVGRKRVKSSLDNVRAAEMNGALTPSRERKVRSGLFATANWQGFEIETPPPTTAIGRASTTKANSG